MAQTVVKIEGMSCQHCVMRVKKAIDQMPGVAQADVSVGSATVTYDPSKVKKEELEQAVEKAGYKVAKG